MSSDADRLSEENRELRSRNRELEETLDAIRSGEVDAIVVSRGDRRQVYALEGADHPYRVLVESIQEGALTLTATGLVLYANTAFAVMRDLPLSAVLGSPLADHIAPQDRAQFAALLEAATDREVRGRLSIRDGTSSFPALLSMTPIEVDGIIRISAVVTNRRRDYGQLRLLARMLDSVVDAVKAVDPEGTIIYWNEAAEKMFGWNSSEMLGRRIFDVGQLSIPENDLREIYGRLETGETWSGEYVVRHRDGRRFSIHENKAPVFDEDGTLLAIISVSHDIGEIKRAEDALRSYAARLKVSNEELQRFAYVASHDLQEPLRNIVSFSQLLDRKYRGRLDGEADEYLGFIIDGGQRMQAMIRDLLQVSRVETTAKPLEPTEVGEIVTLALRSLEAQLEEAGGRVSVERMPCVMADAAQLEQVLTNLVGNAIKYRRPDVPLAIAVSARREEGWWEISVSDNGIGIAPEYYDQIFEMFRRLHTHDEYEGTGIGLAVVKKIVERHGGTIRVTSTPGAGSTFCFTLPAV